VNIFVSNAIKRMSKKRLILSQPLLSVILKRLTQEIIENHGSLENSVVIGLQPRGVFFANRIVEILEQELNKKVLYGTLDATFYRDDFRRGGSLLKPNATNIDFVLENKRVILIDDVLATGRMVRAAIDAMQAFGRPKKVELLCLIDRSYNRDLPIQPDYTGEKVNTPDTQRVLVEWTDQGFKEDKIWLMDS
jgi:pyrimidine operon attenuation protein/uracil phosphoribosyltransferase